MIVVKAGAARLSAIVVEIAGRDVKGAVVGFAVDGAAWIRAVGIALELDEPAGVRRVVKLHANGRVPIQGLDRVAVRPNSRRVAGQAGVRCVHHFRLFGNEFFRRHGVRVRPNRLCIAPASWGGAAWRG